MSSRPPHSHVLAAATLVAAFLTACTSTAGLTQTWTGTSTLADGFVHELRLEIRPDGDALTGSYYVDAVRGTFEGRVAVGETAGADTVVATLTPSPACTYALTGTIGSRTLDATFAPEACPDGQTGTWTLTRP